MLGNLGFGEILLLALIALILFGPAKLPELGRALGRTLKEFKQGARDLMSTEDSPSEPPAPRKDVTPPPPAPAPTQAAPEQTQQAAAPQPEKPASDNRRLPD